MATVCRRFFVARKARLRGDMDVESKETIESEIDELGMALDQFVDRARSLIDGLDGWTLEVTIPAITIRLTKPPDQA